ncbi:MAG: HAMP domain-containing protein [Ilumatobacteraceae bacterium]
MSASSTEALLERTADLPFWRRPRRLRRQIAGALMLTSLFAVLLFGSLNFLAADRLLRQGTEEQLAATAVGRSHSIEVGMERLLRDVSAAASDPSVVAALDEFSVAFDALADRTLEPDQASALIDFYDDDVIAPLAEVGITGLEASELVPASDAGQWLQAHYTIPDPEFDDSAYGEVLAEHDRQLKQFADRIGAVDLMLVSFDDDVVYTTEQRVDLGIDLSTDAVANDLLTQLVVEDLSRVTAGEALLTDYGIYIPGGGKPALFAAATVRRGSRIVGTLVAEVSTDRIDAITTANGDWSGLGLGDGESYVVSSDRILQSTSRPWLENREAYLDDVDDDELRERIIRFDTPVGIQTVETAPVTSAFAGDIFTGNAHNYLGQATFSSSTAIDVPGVEWAVVTDVPASSARRPLVNYLRKMGFVLAIVLPSAAILGLLLARRLSRPIGPAVEAARAVANGERHPDQGRLGNDEFGDLGRRLNMMAAALERQEQELEAEFEQKRNLLLAVLPPHLVDDVGVVAGNGARSDLATVVAVTITPDHEVDDDLLDLLSTAAAGAEAMATECGLERIRVTADRYLFVAGAHGGDEPTDATNDEDGAAAAAAFVDRLCDGLDELGEDVGVDFRTRVGLSTGSVARGVLRRGSLTFGAWGEPVRRALALSALATAGEVLADVGTAQAIDADGVLAAAEGLVDLDGDPVSAFVVRSVEPAETA